MVSRLSSYILAYLRREGLHCLMNEWARVIVGIVVFGAIAWILYSCIIRDAIRRWKDNE